MGAVARRLTFKGGYLRRDGGDPGKLGDPRNGPDGEHRRVEAISGDKPRER
jgi:hypothetical protein